MKPIKIDWNANKPSKNDLTIMWNDLDYEIIEFEFEFIQLLKKNIGGILYFKGFKFNENEIFDWYCSRGMLDEMQFGENFLLSEKVLKTFNKIEGDYMEEERAWTIGLTPKLEMKSEFLIDGVLAELLVKGGAYPSKFKGTPKDAKIKAQIFCNELFKENYSKEFVKFYSSEKSWNSWFIDFAIDKTYLIFCMEKRTLWIIAFTDSD